MISNHFNSNALNDFLDDKGILHYNSKKIEILSIYWFYIIYTIKFPMPNLNLIEVLEIHLDNQKDYVTNLQKDTDVGKIHQITRDGHAHTRILRTAHNACEPQNPSRGVLAKFDEVQQLWERTENLNDDTKAILLEYKLALVDAIKMAIAHARTVN